MSDPDALVPIRHKGTPFKPGQSGNPSGRPKRLAELNALCQSNFPAALRRLRRLIKSNDDELAFRAIQFTFAYILGKPPEGRDLLHVENMRARLTQLVVSPVEVAHQLPEPVLESRPLPTVVAPPPEPPAPPAPTEALDAVTPVQEPSGLVASLLGTRKGQEAIERSIEGTADAMREKFSSKPAGLRCLYRGKDGQCEALAMDGSQWCSPHRTKLFTMVLE